jgi:predicted Rossmann fold flavoprotein
MPESVADIAIVGGGAAGLAAAIFAGEAARPRPSLRIVLLDGAKKLGAKILISGGGRCNVTHERVTFEDFHGSRNRIRNVLAAFTEEDARTWFAALGVELKREETGKLFPMTDQARTVLDALLRRCKELGIVILTEHGVSEIEAEDSGFLVRHARGELRARRVILATGGRSLPRSGSDGHGWTILQRLGHTVTATVPALVPLILESQFFHRQLMGLSQPVELTIAVGGTIAHRCTGSLLWTHFGVSGPVVMDASRFWTLAAAAGGKAEVRSNFWPGLVAQEGERRLLEQIEARPRLTLGKLLAQQLPERFAEVLCGFCGIGPKTPVGQLRREDRQRLLKELTGLILPITADRGWNYAEVTAGGVPLEEINFRTMESRLVPGLYLIGELLDCDGRIGGFNFQWAWSGGYVGGRAAVTSLRAVSADRDVPQKTARSDEETVTRPEYRGSTGRGG